MISSTKANATLNSLKTVQLVRPENARRYWKGIPHIDLVRAVLDGTARRGWLCENVRMHLTAGGQTLSAGFLLRIPDYEPPEGLTPCLGVLTSNKLQHATKFYAGLVDSEQDVSYITAPLDKAKHTLAMDLYNETDSIITRFRDEADLFHWTVELFRGHRLEENECEYILIRAGRLDLIPWSRVGAVDREFRRGCRKFNRFVYAQNNAWNLATAFGRVVRRNAGSEQIKQLAGFSKLLVESVKSEVA